MDVTYKWTSLGSLDNSGGIWPLIELLFMWLWEKRSKTIIKKNCLINNMGKRSIHLTYKCLVFFKLANDFGIDPDIWFWSICILSKLGRYPSSSGKEPDSWLPFKSLQIKIAHILSISGKSKKNELQKMKWIWSFELAKSWAKDDGQHNLQKHQVILQNG